MGNFESEGNMHIAPDAALNPKESAEERRIIIHG
jgi:hypothetical protein